MNEIEIKIILNSLQLLRHWRSQSEQNIKHNRLYTLKNYEEKLEFLNVFRQCEVVIYTILLLHSIFC